MDENHPAHNLFYSVTDPQSPLNNSPAMTTLLFSVLQNNPTKFEEAIRIIGLFMSAAYDKGLEDGKKDQSVTVREED